MSKKIQIGDSIDIEYQIDGEKFSDKTIHEVNELHL